MPQMKNMPLEHGQIDRALGLLANNEALVLRLRTGLVDGHCHSLREVSEFLGSTRAEARNLEWYGWQKLEELARDDHGSRIALRFLLNRAKRPSPEANRILN